MVTCDSKIGESSRSLGESDVDLSFSSLILQNMAVSTLLCKLVFLWGDGFEVVGKIVWTSYEKQLREKLILQRTRQKEYK